MSLGVSAARDIEENKTQTSSSKTKTSLEKEKEKDNKLESDLCNMTDTKNDSVDATGKDKDATVTTDAKDLNKKESNKSDGKKGATSGQLFDDLEPRVTLSSRRKNSFYLQRARRLLRLYDEIKILGGSNEISRACLVVELLKKEETGIVTKMETRMQLSPLNSKGDFGRPQPVIEFVVKRGNYGEFVSGFAQRKMIELFEKQVNIKDIENEEKSDLFRLNSEKETYELSEDCVRNIGMEASFYAEEDKIGLANKFLTESSSKNGGFISLPQFIQYASLLINPKLKNIEFRKILKQKYDLNVGKGIETDDNEHEHEHEDDDDDDDENEHEHGHNDKEHDDDNNNKKNDASDNDMEEIE